MKKFDSYSSTPITGGKLTKEIIINQLTDQQAVMTIYSNVS